MALLILLDTRLMWKQKRYALFRVSIVKRLSIPGYLLYEFILTVAK